jgi:hypothetical protein
MTIVLITLTGLHLPRQRTFHGKFGWKKLPVAGCLFKRTPCYDHRCPTCSTDNADNNHLFQCKHPSQMPWCSRLLATISDTFQPFLDPDLLTIIRIGLRAYFTDSHPDFSEHFPQGYSTTPCEDFILQQTSIGWDHFIWGKLGPSAISVRKRFGLENSLRDGQLPWSSSWPLDPFSCGTFAINAATNTTLPPSSRLLMNKLTTKFGHFIFLNINFCRKMTLFSGIRSMNTSLTQSLNYAPG